MPRATHEQTHDRGMPASSYGTIAIDRLDAIFLDVAGHYAGKRAAQIGREIVASVDAMQLECTHRLVRDFERLLEFRLDGRSQLKL